jgi:hypothetical protein
MLPATTVNAKDARKAFGKLLDAIPKGKRGPMYPEMACVEATMNESFRLLNGVRQYFLDNEHLGGEASPFVKHIDKIIDRPEPKAS